jgi:ribosomal protein S18 acetylase RimI-like enzyme
MSISPLLKTVEELPTVQSLRFRQCDINDAPALAALHVENLSGRLGVALTEAYYRACLESEQHLFICAEEDGTIAGFVGMVCDRITVIKLLLAGQLLTTLTCTASHPSLLCEYLRHLWRWMRIRDFSRKADLPPWEYRPVVVAKAYRSRGVGRLLLASADRILRCRGVTNVFLQVARTNTGALRAYEQSGFEVRLECSYTIFMIKNLAMQKP